MNRNHPIATIRRISDTKPRCRSCGADVDLILADGPPVCRPCIVEGGRLGMATVRRNDTPPRRPR